MNYAIKLVPYYSSADDYTSSTAVLQQFLFVVPLIHFYSVHLIYRSTIPHSVN